MAPTIPHTRYLRVLRILDQAEGNTMLERFRKTHTPFQMLIATILSARAKDDATIPIANELFITYGTPKTLANAPLGEIKRIIKRIGFYNAKAKNIKETARILHEKYQDRVPQTREALMELPGVGRKTANCILAYAFDQPAIAVDTHVHRISNRLGWASTNTPHETEAALEKLIPKKQWNKVNALFVLHGQTICTPISPKCSQCPIEKLCKKIGVTTHR